MIRKIEPMDTKELNRVVEIAAEVHLSKNRDVSGGFLVSGYGFQEYLERANRGELFVYDKNGAIQGFLSTKLGLERDIRVEKWIEEDKIPHLKWIEQVGVSPTSARSGVATALYQYLFETQPEKHFITSLAESPYFNQASRAFHLKMGFSKLGSFQCMEFKGIKNYQGGLYIKALK